MPLKTMLWELFSPRDALMVTLELPAASVLLIGPIGPPAIVPVTGSPPAVPVKLKVVGAP